MKTFLAILTITLLSACATTPNGPEVAGDTAAHVRNFVQNVEPGLRPAAAAAASLYLSYAVEPKDKADMKANLFVISSIVAAVSAEQSPGELSKAIQAALPKSEENKNLADAVAGGWAIAVPFVRGDPQLLLKVTGDLAGGVAQIAGT